MNALATPDDDGDQTESHDSTLCEFTDLGIDFTPRPPREQTLQHAPSWLRDRLPAAPPPGDPAALADCLLAQARVLLALRRYAEAIPKLEEAERLYRTRETPAALADCYHVAAKVYEALGESDKAFDFLRREEELRRRFAA